MTKLPEDPRTLDAMRLVLNTEAIAQTPNPVYQIDSTSEPLTNEEIAQLEEYLQKKREQYPNLKAFNTLTVCKLKNGQWVARRATWIQGWSSPKASLAEVFEKI